jgi:hypothetical protein
MNVKKPQADSMDAALARLPAWEPPPDFAARTAARAVRQRAAVRPVVTDTGYGWIALLLHGLGMAACVSVAAWLGGDLLFALLQSGARQDQPGALGWLLALGSMVLVWRSVRPRPTGAAPAAPRITS